MAQAVNTNTNKLDAFPKKRANRSTTHIRIKKQTKFQLERWMRRHHCKTFSQAINKLLVGENK